MASTDQAISETAIANMAATSLEEHHISSLDEDTSLARFMASQFGFARDELLRLHPWTFARARAVLSPDEAAPAFGWTYSFELPTDCLRVLSISRSGHHNGVQIRHEREGRKVLTDEGPALYVRYIAKERNAAKFDPLFARALGERLALMAAVRITGKQSYVQKAAALYKQALEDAVMTDGLDSGTPESQDRYDVVDVRMGG